MKDLYNKNKTLIHPEDQNKEIWDMIITLVLLIACVITPLNIAFINEDEEQSLGNMITNYVIDFFFLVDILIIFNSAYYNEDSDLIQDRGMIAYNYITGWFFIDLFAIIPFD